MTNVILITVDSLRFDHSGLHGYDRKTTPFIDRFSNKCHSFSDGFSQGHATRLSFPAIFCSRYAHEDGGYKSAPKSKPIIAEYLSNKGIKTAGFHSNAYLTSQFGYDRGFNVFYDFQDEYNHIDYLSKMIFNKINQGGKLHNSLKKFRSLIENNKDGFLTVPYTRADDLTEKAIDWIDSTDDANDHFLWIHYMDPHIPFLPPVQDQREVLGSTIPKQEIVHLRNMYQQGSENLSDTELAMARDLYDSEIHFVDRNIQKLINKVETSMDDKLIIITSDHGEEFKDHGKIGHSQIYDELLHVPLLLKTDREHSYNHNELVALLDLPPTITDFFGLPSPSTFRGKSLFKLLKGDDWDRDFIISEGINAKTHQPVIAIRDHEYKYIREGKQTEIYNVLEDPSETNDLSNNGFDREMISSHIDCYEKHLNRIETAKNTNVTVDKATKDRLKELGYMSE